MAKSKESTMTLAEVLRRRVNKPVYETRPTHVEGLDLRIEKGHDPQLLRRNIGKLATSGRLLAKSRAQIARLTDRQKNPKDVIKDMAVSHPGLHGFVSEKDHLSLTVYPTHKITWNAELLKDSLGVAYSTVVGEDLVTTVSVPLGHETSKGPLTSKKVETALKAGMRRLGFSQDEIPSILQTELVLRVDEAKLGELITSGQVTLLDGAATVEETWPINTDLIP
jgi:hypothetical protein